MGIKMGLFGNLLKKRQPKNAVNTRLMDIMRDIAESKNVNYWNGFTSRKPQEAKEIEHLLNKDMSKVSDVEAFETTTTILRWVSNFNNCRIKDLKKLFLSSTYECLEKDSDIDVAIELVRTKIDEEANIYNISKEHTASYFMHKWLVEARDKRLLEKYDSISLDNKINIAPDISKNNNIENKLIALAKSAVRLLEKYHELDENGKVEALIYFTTCVIDLPTDYDNTLDMDIIEDRYFLLLHDSITCNINNIPPFINSRIKFYNEERYKLKNNPSYTSMAIYTVFFINPLIKDPYDLSKFNKSPFELLALTDALRDIEQLLLKSYPI